MARSRRIGVVGLGRMGGPVAGHLVAAGHEVRGLDPDPRAGDGLSHDVHRAAGDADLDGCEIVLVMAGGSVVREILLADDRLRPVWQGKDVLVCSTVEPSEMRRLHEATTRCGGRLLDAPLCRGDHAARRGDLLALVGGSGEMLTRCAEVLHTFCSDVVHVGGPGAGQTAKLVNNMLLWSNIAGVVEGLRLAEELGVRREPLVDSLLLSSAGSWVLETWARPRTLPWADEDMRVVLETASRVGLDAPVSEVVQRVIGDVRASEMLAEGGFGTVGWGLPARPGPEEDAPSR